jgi:hypothetical protein
VPIHYFSLILSIENKENISKWKIPSGISILRKVGIQRPEEPS